MSTSYRHPLKPPIPQRIMILLHDHRDKWEDYEVPQIITQKGIGRELGLRQTHVSRALSELSSEGLIRIKSSHVTGEKRKKRSYYLSESGDRSIIGYLNKVNSTKVPVRMEDRKLKTYEVSRAMDILSSKKGYRLTFHEMLKDHFNGSEIEVLKSEKRIDSPTYEPFYGRNAEIERIQEFIEGNSRFLMILSIAGMGKTSLLSWTMASIKDRPHTWVQIDKWLRPIRLLRQWGEDLQRIGFSGLIDHMNSTDGEDIVKGVELFKELSGKSGTLHFIDDFQKADGSIVELFQMIKEMPDRNESFKMIIGTREVPEIYGPRDLKIDGSVMEMNLNGLKKDAGYQFLGSLAVPQIEWDTILALTNGHPLSMKLMASMGTHGIISEIIDVKSYFQDEVMDSLSEDEVHALEMAAIYEMPVEIEAVIISSSRKTIRSLVDKQLLHKLGDGRFRVHDLVRKIILDSMSADRRSELLKDGINYLSNRGSDLEMVHLILLLENDGRIEEIHRLLLDVGEFLVQKGHTQILEYIVTIKEDDLGDIDRIKYLILRSEVFLLNDNRSEALKYLDQALIVSEQMKGKESEVTALVSRIFSRKASMMPRSKAITILKKNVKYQREFGNKKDLGKALNNYSSALMNHGEPDRALKTLKEAHDIFQRIGDPTSMIFVDLNRCTALVMKRDLKKARSILNEIEKFKMKDPSIRSRILFKTGVLKRSISDFDGADRDLKTVFNDLNRHEDVSGSFNVLVELVENSIRSGERSRTRRYLDRALGILEASDIDPARSLDLYLVSEDLIKDKQKVLGRISEISLDRMEPRSIIAWVDSRIEMSKDPSSLIPFLKMMEKDMGQVKGVILLQMRIGSILIRSGNMREGRAILENARKGSIRCKFEKAEKRIDRILNERSV